MMTRPHPAGARPRLSPLDAWLSAADNALKTLSHAGHASRACPAAHHGGTPPAATELTDAERKLSGALMRVNHVGEVCAQALYNAQRLATQDAALQAHFDAASREETDHLAWTQQRLQSLGDRASVLNPLWYLGAFGLGYLAGRQGAAWSLGFVAETERQVAQHLASHLDRLPANDAPSRAIVEHMQADEMRHAKDADEAGARALPPLVRGLMRAAAKVMTTVAHRI